MASQDKETLHTYLRRYFEKVSQVNAKQFGAKTEMRKVSPTTWPPPENTKIDTLLGQFTILVVSATGKVTPLTAGKKDS